MERIKINLSEVEIKDLNGAIYKVDDLSKQIGNIIFTNAASIEVSDIARTLHAGKTAEVNEPELNEIMQVVASNPYYKPFAQMQIVHYLSNKSNEFNKVK